jgi:NAD-dependent SIR2 family protein deacetylase
MGEHVRKLLAKRRGLVKLSCVLCEQRVGWRDVGRIQQMLEQDGVILCLHCRKSLMTAMPRHDWYGEPV